MSSESGKRDAPARVLIVDDTEAIRNLVAFVATEAGLEVCATAVDGRDGVEAARAHQPDAVVLDQEMPVLDGISALPLICDAAPGAVVAMFSSSVDRSLGERALRLGGAAFFRKGVDSVDDLVAFLRDRASGTA